MKTKTKMKNERADRITTPIGIAVYPYLSKPDTKFDDDGKFRVRLRLPEDEANELMAKIQEQYNIAYQEECNRQRTRKLKCSSLPWRDAVDEDDKPTGEVEFNFSSKASGINRETKETWTRTIPVFDAKRKPINTDKIQVGTGSTVRVSFFISPFYTKLLGFGVSLRLIGVQVIDLVKGGGRSAEDMGFGEEEGWEDDEVVETATDDDDETSEELVETEEVLGLDDDEEADADEEAPVKKAVKKLATKKGVKKAVKKAVKKPATKKRSR